MRSAGGVIASIIPFYMLSFVGIAGVFAFYGHVFMADEIAASIGWPAGNPFQFEVAVANLGYGVAGLLSFRYGGGFRWATAVFMAVFLWGAAYGHIYQFVEYDNRHPDNIGTVLYIDIAMPLILLGLLTAEAVLQRGRART